MEGAWNIGYHFTPSDEELLQILAIKLRGGYEILGGHAMKEIDVYQKEPWLVFDKDESEPFYVFTSLKKKSSSRSRMDRKVGSGTWRMERSIDVVDQGDKVVGYKKMLTFEEEKKKKKNIENGRWIMHDFSLRDVSTQNSLSLLSFFHFLNLVFSFCNWVLGFDGIFSNVCWFEIVLPSNGVSGHKLQEITLALELQGSLPYRKEDYIGGIRDLFNA